MSHSEIIDGTVQPILFEDDDGYWLAFYDSLREGIDILSWHYWARNVTEIENIANSIVYALHHVGIECYGYWRGYVGDEVCNRWNDDRDLHIDEDGNPIDGAETIALERLIAENTDFLQDRCYFVQVIKQHHYLRKDKKATQVNVKYIHLSLEAHDVPLADLTRALKHLSRD